MTTQLKARYPLIVALSMRLDSTNGLLTPSRSEGERMPFRAGEGAGDQLLSGVLNQGDNHA